MLKQSEIVAPSTRTSEVPPRQALKLKTTLKAGFIGDVPRTG